MVLCSCRYILTLVISCASCGRYWSSQNTTGMPELRARVTASLTQSRMAASLHWHMRQMSPCFHVLAQQHLAGVDVGDVGHAVFGNLEGLVVRAVLFGLLGHQADVGHGAHGAWDRMRRATCRS